MNWYLNVIKNYVGFSGRARRKEYWMFYLFHMIFTVVFAIIDFVVGIYPTLTLLYSLAVLLPFLSVIVRRLHDTGRSGAWYFIGFIPFIGGIWLLVLTCLDGTQGDNTFGPSPKEAEFDIV